MNLAEAEALAAILEPRTRDAFLRAVREIVERANIGLIEEAVRDGQIQEVFLQLGIAGSAAMLPLQEQMRSNYLLAAERTLQTINKPRGGVFNVFFDVQEREPADYLRQISSQKIVEIVEEQRTAVREILQFNSEQGNNPRAAALDVVGRVQDGTRRGGVVGLNSQQAKFVANMKRELASGDAQAMANYFNRARRDRRFDGIVRKAIEAGKPVNKVDVDRLAGRYADRLLQLRGETIARTETLTAMSEAQNHALNQVLASQGIPPEKATRVWRTSSDARVRETHAAIAGSVAPLNGRFPNGLRYPRDPQGPASETVACRCWAEPKIDYIGAVNEG